MIWLIWFVICLPLSMVLTSYCKEPTPGLTCALAGYVVMDLIQMFFSTEDSD